MVHVSDQARIVVVDDSEELRALIRRVFDREDDFSVVGEAGDGRAGVEVALEQQPDVVLLDIAMPVLDGLQALPLLRKSCPEALLVVLSGFGSDSMAAQKALELGAHGFLNKGDAQGKLARRLRVIVDAHRARSAWVITPRPVDT